MEGALNRLLINCNWGESIEIANQPKPFTEDALRGLFKHSVKYLTEVMNIATGVAQIKGNATITSAEIEQAVTMKEEGIHKFLPDS